MQHRAFIAQIPLKDGKPDLDLPEDAEYWKEWPTLWHATWQGHYLTVKKLGTIGDDVVVAGVGDKAILLGLQHLGAKVMLLKTAWQDAQKRTWLLAHGVREEDGKPLAPNMYSGDSAWSLGDDYEAPEPE